MRKTIFNTKDFFTVIITSIILGTVITCLKLSTSPLLVDSLSLEGAFFQARDGHIIFEQRYYTALLLTSYLNVFILTPIISRILMSDYEAVKAFVFIRMRNVAKWYAGKLLQSALYCFFAAFTYNTAIIVCAALMGYRAESTANAVSYLIISILAGFLILFITVSAVQICCFRIPDYAAIALIICVSCGVLYLIHFGPMKLMQFNLLSFYFASLFTVYPNTQELYNLPVWIYYAAIIAFTAGLLAAGKHILQKSDKL